MGRKNKRLHLHVNSNYFKGPVCCSCCALHTRLSNVHEQLSAFMNRILKFLLFDFSAKRKVEKVTGMPLVDSWRTTNSLCEFLSLLLLLLFWL